MLYSLSALQKPQDNFENMSAYSSCSKGQYAVLSIRLYVHNV